MPTEFIESRISDRIRVSEVRIEVPASSGRGLFPILILLSAFLMFQTELILAKYILPWFGGAPAVWNTCMLFYQSTLLGGYFYSHKVSSRFGSGRQAQIHLGVLGITLAAFLTTVVLWGSPLTPASRWKYVLADSPILHIAAVLALAVGVPFFFLSTTGPLMQSWYARLNPTGSPYRLYAVSNLGSLVGLLGYPFLLEWLLPIRKQALLWTLLFGLFLVLTAFQIWMFTKQTAGDAAPRLRLREEVRWPQFATWCGLSACASVMLFATTNLICQNIPTSPFLWVVPLSIYLLSFTICFESSRWYKRPVFFGVYVVAVCLTARMMVTLPNDLDAISQLGTYFLLLFAVCMVCNGELERRKPEEANGTTHFYLSIALGGALGGAFVVIVAPWWFGGFYEFHLAVVATGLLILGITIAGLLPRANARGKYQRLQTSALFAAGVGCLLAFARATRVEMQRESGNVVQLRNFFGIKRVYDRDGTRYLQHGGIVHGAQFLAEPLQMRPTMYYTTHTGIGMLLTNYRQLTGRSESAPLRYGMIGLGTGTLAAYAHAGDSMRFYEIDPQDIQLAAGPKPLFTFVQKSSGKIGTVLGDARLNLEAEAARHDFQNFDILVLDAFSSDAPPVHMLTSEAMQVFLQHLRGPDSVIAVNISNRVLDLTPVLRALSAQSKLAFDDIGGLNGFDWVLLSKDKKLLEHPTLARPFDWSDTPVLWTDDYSNLLSVLKK